MIQLSIHYPLPGQYVKHKVRLEGEVSGATTDTILRTVVRPETKLTYHPQVGRLNIDTDSNLVIGATYLGNSETGTHTGERFRILVVKCSEAAKENMDYYLEHAEKLGWPGIPELPKGAKVVSELSVIRNDYNADDEILPIHPRTKPISRAAKTKVFVSHSSHDINVATALIDVIEAAFTLQAEDIRCTSVQGYKLPAGVHTSTQLRDEIATSQVLIGILTPRSISSSYVIFELGASWGLQCSTFPALARGATPSIIPGPLREQNAVKLTDAGDCHQLIDELAKKTTLRIRPGVSARVSKKITALNRVAEQRDDSVCCQ